MRYKKALAVMAAFKIAVLTAWVFTGFDLKASQVLAETQAQVQPAQGHGDEAPKKPDQTYAGDKALLDAISRRQADLDAREEEIKVREERLNVLKKDIEEKLAQINKARGEVEGLSMKIKEKDAERLNKVVRIYESMSPEEAAPRMERLDEETAVSVLGVMSPKKAAKIIAVMDVDKAARLSLAIKSRRD